MKLLVFKVGVVFLLLHKRDAGLLRLKICHVSFILSDKFSGGNENGGTFWRVDVLSYSTRPSVSLREKQHSVMQPQLSSTATLYLGVLNNLSPEQKLDLIAQLSQSLKDFYRSDQQNLAALFGAYKSVESAEEIIASIRASRASNREIEPL